MPHRIIDGCANNLTLVMHIKRSQPETLPSWRSCTRQWCRWQDAPLSGDIALQLGSATTMASWPTNLNIPTLPMQINPAILAFTMPYRLEDIDKAALRHIRAGWLAQACMPTELTWGPRRC